VDDTGSPFSMVDAARITLADHRAHDLFAHGGGPSGRVSTSQSLGRLPSSFSRPRLRRHPRNCWTSPGKPMMLANGKAWEVLVRTLATQTAIRAPYPPLAPLEPSPSSCAWATAAAPRPLGRGAPERRSGKCRFHLFHSSIERTMSVLTTRYNQL
jgi:hypothetical protein